MMRAMHGMWIAGLTILMLGCQAEVISGSTGGGGSKDSATSGGVISGGTGGSSGTGDIDGGPAPLPDDGAAIAMLFSELPASDPTPDTSGVSTGGSTIDPNTLLLFVSNGAQSCVNPYAQPGGCVSRYQVGINLPPNLQAVGTYPLTDLGFISITEPGDPGTCSGGGGSYWDGTIAITSIDATHVTFTLAGTGSIFSNPGNADGTYTAKRCF